MRTGRASPGAGREAAGRRLRQRGAAAADRRLRRARAAVLTISPYDKGTIKAIEKAIQQSDLGCEPVERRPDHPARVPGAHRGAPQGPREGRAHTGPRRAGWRCATPAATPARSSRLEKDGEISKDDLDRTEKDLEKRTHEVVAEIDELLKHKEQELLHRSRSPAERRLSGDRHRQRAAGLAWWSADVPEDRVPEFDDDRPEAPPAEGVRILGAEEAQAAVEGGPIGPSPRSRRRRRRRPAPPDDVQPAARFPLPADRLPGDDPGPSPRPAPAPRHRCGSGGSRRARCRCRTGPNHRRERCR